MNPIKAAFVFILGILTTPALAQQTRSIPQQRYEVKTNGGHYSSVLVNVSSDYSDCREIVVNLEIREPNAGPNIVSTQSMFDLRDIGALKILSYLRLLQSYDLYEAPIKSVNGEVRFLNFGLIFSEFMTAHYQYPDGFPEYKDAPIPETYLTDLTNFLKGC